ncbi:MAG: hypothetical protein ACIAZJ_26450, partial [Gimesia chilikensis]|uniref:hypothetical protein n=1 Tax=Gimesia chilikensis TaxID=2605989 RepID=UPI0037BE0CB3
MLLTNWLGNLTSRILKRPVYRSRERRSLRRRWQAVVNNQIVAAESLEDRTLLTSLFQGELLPDAAINPGHLDLTGQAVAVDGDWMVVGAPEADTSQGVDSGAVYIYVRNDANTPGNETDDTWDFHSTLLTPSLSNPEYDNFGTAVDIDGDLIIVGSPFATDGDSPSSAYIFTRMDSGTFNDLTDDVWSFTTTLSRSEDMEPLGQEGFGNAVAIKGNTAVLGVHSDRSFGYPLGATYVFSTDDSWSSHSVNTLRASDGTGDDWFGNSVSVTEDGNTIIVGSYRDDSSTGAVYFYSRDRMGTPQVSDDNWSETQKVSANVAGSQFGWAVDIDGNTAIVGANYRPDPVNAGSAYILEADEFNNWGIVAELRAADAAQYEQYGYSVSISGNLAVVGNVFDDDLISNAGSAYIYNGAGGWTSAPVQKIYPSDPTLHTNFGRSVSISGDTIVVGANAHEHDYGGTTGIVKTGSAYAFGPSSPLSPTVFVDDNFSNPVVGQDPDGPGGAIEFGYDAFARIQDAIDKVADGGTIFIAPGTYLGNANATSSRTDKDVTIAIGVSAAQVVMNGDLSYDFGDTLDFQIAGNTAGASYDQFVVNDSVSINNSFLKLQDFYNPLEGDQFILIQNDGIDPIEGEFFLDGTLTRLTEGYEFTDFMGVAGQSAYLTYKGGDGNDLAIVVEDSTPQTSLPVNGTADQYTLKLVGEHVMLSDDTTGDILYNVPLSALGGPLVIDGEPGQDDTLTIDLTGIDDSTPLQVVFNGGTAGNDAINLTGGDLVTMNYYFDSASDGRIALNTPMNEFLTYTGLEPITSTVDSENVVLYYGNSSETISITDAGGGMTTVNSTAGEMLTFIDPTDVLLINAGGGDDIINLDSLAANYSGELRIVGGDDDDTLNVNTEVSLAADRFLLFTAEDIFLNGGSITTNGNVWQTFHGDVTLGADTTINNIGGSSVYFDFTVSGNYSLDVSTAGFIAFYNSVTVDSLIANAGTVIAQLSGSINTGANDVELTAGESIAITNITTSGEVRITAVTGEIADYSADESSNINADRAVLRAGTKIGGDADNTLETSVNTLAASVANGNIEIVNTDALEIGTVDSLDGVTATNGDVIITAASPLTVNQTISGDSVTLTTIDSAAAGDNLTINADITSTVSDISLNSGDDFTLSALATLTASTTIDINVDPSAGDPDAAGSTVDLVGGVSATGTTITGGDDADMFNITPSANSPVSVLGGNPSVSPGDTLTYLTPTGETTTFAPIDSDGGTISVTGGSADVTFDEIENMTMSGASSLVVNGTFNSDVLTITASNSNSGTYQLNNGPVVHFSNITDFTFNGLQGLDRLDIINPTGGVFDPVDGVTYNANTGTIQILGGAATTVEHRMTTSTNGSLFYDGESTATINYNGVGSVFAVNDQVSVTDRILTYNTGDEDFIISDGEFAVSTTVDSDGGPSVSFSSPTGSLTINTTVGDDTLTFYDLALDFDADLNINGGTVEFIRDLDFNSGDLNLDVDSVEISAALSTTGNVNIQAMYEIQMLASSFVGSIDAGVGDINLTGGWIQLRSLTTTGDVSLTANTTAIYDYNGRSVNITADQVALRSVTGSEGLEINANTLAASADTGNMSFVNSGDLIIGTVDGLSGLTASEGLVNVITNGALTVNDAVYAIDAVDLMTGDTSNSGEDLTINADVTSNSAIVTLSAADILTIATGSTVSGGEVQMLIDAGLPGTNDPAGGTAHINGTLLGFTLELRGGNHDDTVIIDSNGGTNDDGGTLDAFDFPFTFYGFLGFDTFILDDSGDTTGDTIEIQDLAPGSGLIRGMASPGTDITYDSGVDQVTLATGTGADDITLTPNTVTAFNILGGDPTMAPGDTLTYVTPAEEVGLLTPDGPDGGTITIVDDMVGYKDVVFDEIETTLITENLTIEGTAGDDELIITATSANSGTYQLNGGAIIAFNNLTDLTFNGLDGDDRLVINNPTGGLFNPVDGVIFNGGTGGETNGDTLEILGGTAGTVEHRFVNDNEGAIHYDGQLNATIVYTGLEPIIDTIEAASREFHYSDSSETITLTDAGSGQSTIDSTAGELVTFVNPTSFLNLFSGGGSDIINIDSLEMVPAAPIGLEIDAGEGDDTINVGSNIAEGPLSITGSLTLKGGEGDDTFNLDSLAADLNLNLGILGQDGANDILNVNSALSTNSTSSVSFDTETINLNGGSITSAGSQYYSGNVVLGTNMTIDAGDQLFLEGTINGAFTLDVSAISLIAFLENITTSGLTANSSGFLNMEPDLEINAGAGDISLTADAPIGLASLTTSGNIDVTSGNGSIYDINGDANNITANNAALRAQGNIYENSDYLNTQVNTLAAVSNTGDILIENIGNLQIGSFDGLLGLTAVQGAVTVNNTGAISVTENITARDEVSLDTGDLVGTDEDVSITNGARVRSTNSSIYLFAGDDFLLDVTSSILASTTFVIHMDTYGAEDPEAEGGNMSLLGTVASSSEVNIYAGSGSDTFNVTPSMGTNIRITAGFPMSPASPGDTFNYITPAGQRASLLPFGDDAGVITPTGGYASVYFDEMETVSLEGDIRVVGGSFGEQLLLNATSSDAGSFQMIRNAVPSVLVNMDNVTAFTFDAGGGDDLLQITNPTGSLFAPVNGIAFNGGSGNETNGDKLKIQGGSATTVEHSFTNDSDGSVLYNGAGTATITYTGLEPIIDTIDATDRIFTFTGADETITLSDSGTAGQTLIDSTLGESVSFANPTGSVTINGNTGSDIVEIYGVDAAFDADLIINGGYAQLKGATNIGSGDLDLDVDLANLAAAFTTMGNVEIDTVGFLDMETTGRINAGSGNIDLTGASVYLAEVTTTGDVTVTATLVSIFDVNDVANNITADHVALRSAYDIGSHISPGNERIDLQVNTLAASATGDIAVLNNGALEVGYYDGLTGVASTGGLVSISASDHLTVNENVNADSTVYITAVDSASTGNDLTVYADVTSNTDTVRLSAGDILTVSSGATVNAATNIYLYIDTGSAGALDAEGGIANLNGVLTSVSDIRLYGGVSDDTAIIDDNGGTTNDGGTVDNIQNQFTFYGIGGTDSFILDDSGDTTGDTIAITETGSGSGAVTGAGIADILFTSGMDQLTLTTGTAADNITVSPNLETVIDLFGGDPTLAPGDTLTYLTPGAVTTTNTSDGAAGGTVSATAGYENVSFDQIETLNMAASSNLVIVGTSGNDILTITANSSNSGSYQLNGGPIVNFADITNFTFEGLSGDDRLVINNPTTGVFAPLNGITFNGGEGGETLGDTLDILGGTADTIEHQFTNNSSGFIYVNGNATPFISYTGLEPITDTIVATNRNFTFNAGTETITVSDAGPAGQTLIDSTLGESVSFVNPTQSLTITSNIGSDTIEFDGLDAGFDADLTVAVGVIEVNGAIDIGSGELLFDAGIVFVDDAITTTGNVTIETNSSLIMYATGSIDAGASFIELTGSLVRIGEINTIGDVSITATISGIFDSNGLANNITANNVVLRSASAIGSTGSMDADRIDMQVNTIAATADYHIAIINTGSLNIGTVDGLSGLKSNTGIVSVHSSEFLNVNATIEAEEAVFLTVDDSAAAVNDLTVNADITSHAANINLTAGDILNITDGVTLNAATSMYIYIDTGTNPSGLIDPEGGIAYLTGTLIAPDGIQILGGSHDDLIIIDSNGGTTNDGGIVDNIQNAFTILGSSGSDSLILDDSGDTTGDTIAITTATAPVPAGAGSITGVGLADFDYTTLENITLTTGTAADDITVTPSTDTSINIVGGDPVMSPGDSLTYLTPVGANASLSPDGADGGTISATGGYQGVTFDEIESLTLADNPVLNLVGTSGHDTLIITATNSNSGTYQLNGGPIVSFANITDLTFDGLASDDRLVINNPTGGVFDPVNGIIFNGGDGNETNGDSLEILGGMTERVEHEFVNDSDGSIYFDSEMTATVVYTGLEPIIDTIEAEWRIFQYSDSAETVTVTDAGSGLTSIDSTAGEMVTFAAPTEVLAIFTGDGDDTLNIDSLAADYGAQLVIYGEGGTNDTVNVNSVLSIGESHRIVFAVEAVNLNGGSITSGGSQSYSGDVTLGTNTIIDAGSDLSFFRSVTGAYTLDLQSDTAIVFRDTVLTGALTANADGSIVMLDDASINTGAGNISLIAGLAVALMDVTTTGDVVITAMTGHIIDDNGAAVNITANRAALRAFEDIGFDGPELETQVNLLSASSNTGDIRIINTGALQIGSFDGLPGLTATNGNISVESSGAITVTEDVTANSIDFNAAIVNLDSDLDSSTITGNATNVNVLGSTGGAEIQDAVDLSAAGGTVQIAAGTYTPSSTITVTNALTIQGAQAGIDPRPGTGSLRDETDDTTETIIDGGGSLSRIFLIDADNVTLNGLVITNGTGDLVRSSNPVDNITVQYNIIHNSTGDEGVQLANAGNSTIQYNYIFDIEGDGANFDTASNSSIRFNEMRNIRSTNAAIFVDDSEAITIEGNYLDLGHLNNNDGIKVNDFSGTYNTETSYIINNTVVDSLQDGITIGRSNVVVSGNDVSGSSSNNGVFYVSETVDNVEITNNLIHDNLAAVSGTDTNYAIRIGKNPSDFPTNVIVRDNSIVNNDGLIFFSQNSQANLDALRNWWGSTDASVIAAGIVGVMDGGGYTNGSIDFSTILTSGADTDGVTPGFQPDTSSLSVHDFGSEPATGSRIQNALDLLDDSGTLFIQSGTYTGNVDTTATGTDMSVTLAPGKSPGQVTINGNLTLNADDVLELELNGTAAGTAFDQLIVSGTLNLGSASLNLIDGFDPAEGDQFLLLANDGTDPVVGTFAGLAEGYEFENFLGVIGQSAFLTYLGGDGNDVAIIVEDSTPQITLPVNSQSNNYRLELSGSHLILTDVDSGEVIYNVPMNALGGPLVIEGEPDEDDTLIVDMTGIDENTPLQIIFKGGAGGNDTLAFEGGSLSSMEYFFTNASDGSVQLNGSGTNFLTYTGLEPITSTVNVTNVTLNYGADSETITVTGAGGGQTTVNSTSGEVLTFFNPTGTLTINAGAGDDIVNVDSLDAAFSANIIINGEADDDTVNLAHGLNLGSGSTTISSDDININGAVTSTGNLAFNAGDIIAFIGGGGSLNAGTGEIELIAGNNVELGSVTTTTEVRITAVSGSIIDSNANEDAGSSITADRAVLRAMLSIGTGGAGDLETDLNVIAASNDMGDLAIDNSGDLDIDTVDGLSGLSVQGSLILTTTGELTVSQAVTGQTISLTTFDASDTGQDLNINANISSTASNLILEAGDDLNIGQGITVEAVNILAIFIDYLSSDLLGATANLNGILTAGTEIQVNGYIQDDTVIIDSNGGTANDGGTVDGIQSHLRLNGFLGNDQLILDDSGDVTGDTILIRNFGLGSGFIDGAGEAGVRYDFDTAALSELTLNTGVGTDDISVELGNGMNNATISSAGGNDNLTILGRAGGDDFLSVSPIDSDEVLITDINTSNQISFDGLAGSLLIDGRGSSSSDHVIVHGTSGADNTIIDTIGGILTTTINPSLISVGVQNIDYLDVRTGSGADQIQVSPHSDIAIDIYGDAPSILPGDVLNYTTPAGETSTLNPIDASSGSITTTGGFANITYDGIETQNELTASPDLTVDGTAADDILTINATGADSGTYQINSGPVIAFSGITSFTYNGLDGDDRLVINNPTGALFDPSGGIFFNGGTGGEDGDGDVLEILGGLATTVEHRFTNANDGSIFFDGEGTATITYTGLEPVLDTIAATDRIFSFLGAAETISLTDGGIGGQSQIDSTLGESVIFTHPTGTLTINTEASGGSGADTVNLDGVDAAFTANLTVNAGTDDIINTGTVDIGAGVLDLTGGQVFVNGAFTTTGSVDIDSTFADITFAAAGSIDAGASDIDLTAIYNVESLNVTTNSEVRVTATGGGINDLTGNAQITADRAALRANAAGGITGIETDLNTLAASATGGAFRIDNSGNLEIGTVDGLSGITAEGDIDLGIGGTLNINQGIEATGAPSLGILVAAEGDINVNSTVQTNGGEITLFADNNLLLGATSVVDTTSAAVVTLTANLGFGAGTFTQNEGGIVNARGGDLDVRGDGDLRIANLQSAGGTISITAVSGTIIDNTAGEASLITGNEVALRAIYGSGAVGVSDIDMAVTRVAAVSFLGDIILTNTGALEIGTVDGLVGVRAGTLSAGQVFVAATSPLTVASDVTASGIVTLTAADSAGAGDDLTINTGVTVESTGSEVSLNSGDNFLLNVGASVIADTTISIIADPANGDPDAVGATIDLLGNVDATQTLIYGGDDDDTFNILPTGDSPISIIGGDPTLPAVPGDVLNMDFTGLVNAPVLTLGMGPGSGQFSFLAPDTEQAVNYTSIEDVNTNGSGSYHLVLDMFFSGFEDASDDTIDVGLDAGGTNLLIDINGSNFFTGNDADI